MNVRAFGGRIPRAAFERQRQVGQETAERSETRDDLSIGALLQLFWRRAALIFAVTAAGTGLAAAYLATATAQYTATVRLVVDARTPRILNLDEVLPALTSETAAIENQVEQLRSRRIAEQVVLKFPASSASRPAWTNALDAKRGELSRERALHELMRRTVIERKGLSQVIDISHRDPNPAAAAGTANALADAFLADQLEMKQSAVRDANKGLAQRVAEISEQLGKAEERIQAYRVEHELFDESDAQQYGQREIARQTQQLFVARAKAAEAKGRLQLDQRAPPPGDEASRIASATKDSLDTQVLVLEQGLAALKKQQAEVNLAVVGLAALEREAEVIRQLYLGLLKRQKETQAQEGLYAADARVIAYAAPPIDPSSPKVVPALGLAFGGSLMVGLLIALLADKHPFVVRNRDDVERHLGIAPIASFPAAVAGAAGLKPAGKPSRIPAEVEFTQAALQLYLWACRRRGDGSSQVLLVASALPGEGKTSISIGLAACAARAGTRTLLVDADLWSASLTSQLAAATSSTWIDAVQGRATVANAIAPIRDNLDLLPARRAEPAAICEVMASRRLADLLDELAPVYELVIIDSPALLSCPESVALLGIAERAALVVRPAGTPVKAMRSALKLIETAGNPDLGVLLNAAPRPRFLKTGRLPANQ